MMSANLMDCANQSYTPLSQSFREETFFSPVCNTNESTYSEMVFNSQNVPQQDNERLTSNPSCMYGSCERLDLRRNWFGQENMYSNAFPYQSLENFNSIFDPLSGDVFPQCYEYGEFMNGFELL